MQQANTTSRPALEKPNLLRDILRRSDTTTVIVALILFLFFAASNSSFLTGYNLFNVSRTVALYVFIALGQAIVVVIGGMNLSLGNIGGLAVVTAGYCMEKLGFSPVVAFGMALLVGALCGMVNGMLIIRTRLSAFVITLATSFIYAGLVNGISQGFPYTKLPKDITVLGQGDILGIPNLFILMAVLLVFVFLFFRFSVLGRRILATGGNLDAARLSGIRTDNIILICNIASGVFAALAGILWISRTASAQPATGGDWLIVSFAVSIIGGTVLTGGDISALGLFAAAVMLTLIRNGLIMLNVNVYFEQTYLGLLILLAVSVETFRSSLGSIPGRLLRRQRDANAA
jgi:ribose transport system permease protein